jgi:hypothetical protein
MSSSWKRHSLGEMSSAKQAFVFRPPRSMIHDGMFLRLYMYAATIYEEGSEAGVAGKTYTEDHAIRRPKRRVLVPVAVLAACFLAMAGAGRPSSGPLHFRLDKAACYMLHSFVQTQPCT